MAKDRLPNWSWKGSIARASHISQCQYAKPLLVGCQVLASVEQNGKIQELVAQADALPMKDSVGSYFPSDIPLTTCLEK